jgi:hypothetical protein
MGSYSVSSATADLRQRYDVDIWRRQGRLAFSLAAVAVVCELTISGNTLMAAGVPYTDDGGMLLVKIHPGSYFCMGAFAARLAETGLDRSGLASLIRSARGAIIFLACIAICLAYGGAQTGSGGLIALIDTFLPAGFLAVVLHNVPAPRLVLLRRIIVAMIAVNAMLALVEASCGLNLIPSLQRSVDAAAEFRPTGFFDHPLTGAAVSCMGLFILSAQKRSARILALQAVLAASLIAYGGRVALAVAAAAFIWAQISRLQNRAIRRESLLRPMIAAGAVITGAAAAGLSMLMSGMGERLLRHMYWDPSAGARILEFHVLDHLQFSEIVFGCRRADFLNTIEQLRLSYGIDVIENFWLLMFCSLGAIGFCVFAAGLLGLFRYLWGLNGGSARPLVMAFIVIASASNSLGRKSTLLVTLVACAAVCGITGQDAAFRRCQYTKPWSGGVPC